MSLSSPTLQDAFALEREFQVEPYDLNSRGLVSEFAYLRWLETLRTALLHRDFGDFPQHYPPILISNHLHYRQPIGAPNQIWGRIHGRIWLANLGQCQWTVQIGLRLVQKTTVAASEKWLITAVQVGQFIDLSTMTAMALPDRITRRYWNHQWTL